MLRRTCDDERAGRVAAQAEIRRLRAAEAAAGGVVAQCSDGERRLTRKLATVENELDRVKSRLSNAAAAQKRTQAELQDSRRDHACLERACAQLQDGARLVDAEKVELARQLRELVQQKTSLQGQLEQVLPAYAEAKSRWGEEKRQLLKHVEHYRKMAIRQKVDPRGRPAAGPEDAQLSARGAELELLRDGQRADGAAAIVPLPLSGADAAAAYGSSDEHNYALMAYINELVRPC